MYARAAYAIYLERLCGVVVNVDALVMSDGRQATAMSSVSWRAKEVESASANLQAFSRCA